MKKTLIVLVAAASVLFSSCEFLDKVAHDAASIANLANCEYSMKNVSNVSVAGVNLKNVTNGNISISDVASLTAALVKKQVPLNMDVNLGVKNPTDRSALLSTLDWALDVANTEFCQGTTTQSYNINANTTTTVPLGVNTDLYSLFSKEGISSLKTFASSFKSDGTSSQLGLRVRPALTVAGKVIKSPGYITVMKAGKSVTSTASNSAVSGSSNNSTGTTGGSTVGRKKS